MNGIEEGISAAKFKPLRINRKEHNNRIDDEIVAKIRKSRFIVADLTSQNAGLISKPVSPWALANQ